MRIANLFGAKQGTSSSIGRLPIPLYLPVLAAFLFAAVFIGYEHVNGGVKTHHFLGRADLQGFSNWLSLLILPSLGALFAIRVNSLHSQQLSQKRSSILFVLLAAMLYGLTMAASFHFGLQQLTSGLFFSLLALALALPIYRAEYIFGFVVGMTITFGSVIPLCIAIVLATISFVVRHAAIFVWSSIRSKRG